MVHEVKKIETKLPQLKFLIRDWVVVLAVIGIMIHLFGVSISTIIGIYLGYRIMRLVVRVIGLALSIIFTVVSILIMIAIISLIIF